MSVGSVYSLVNVDVRSLAIAVTVIQLVHRWRIDGCTVHVGHFRWFSYVRHGGHCCWAPRVLPKGPHVALAATVWRHGLVDLIANQDANQDAKMSKEGSTRST